jgi:glucosylceramidase
LGSPLINYFLAIGDFCVKSYNFDNVTGDSDLVYFDGEVTHDQAHMIPFIKRANETLRSWNSKAPGLRVFASPWSPPAWMKFPVPPNNFPTMDGSAVPQGLMNEYFASWALYFSKFITAYKNQGTTPVVLLIGTLVSNSSGFSGVNLWGITVQNEPEFAAPWEACVYNATTELDFIGNFLGPQLEKVIRIDTTITFCKNCFSTSILPWYLSIGPPRNCDYGL